jgi:phage repressor protein C with HTH and peptisase S24 domain
MGVKQVDTKEYVSVLREIAEEGKVVSMLIAGSSMSPFLCHNRDYIYFTKPDRELRRGDMVFYQRDSGQYVMHRIYRVKPEGYYMTGDAQTEIEGPLRRDQIFALIIKVKRKGKMIRPGDFWWEFFEHVWIRIIHLRQIVLKLYAVFTGKFRR